MVPVSLRWELQTGMEAEKQLRKIKFGKIKKMKLNCVESGTTSCTTNHEQ